MNERWSIFHQSSERNEESHFEAQKFSERSEVCFQYRGFAFGSGEVGRCFYGILFAIGKIGRSKEILGLVGHFLKISIIP